MVEEFMARLKPESWQLLKRYPIVTRVIPAGSIAEKSSIFRVLIKKDELILKNEGTAFGKIIDKHIYLLFDKINKENIFVSTEGLKKVNKQEHIKKIFEASQ